MMAAEWPIAVTYLLVTALILAILLSLACRAITRRLATARIRTLNARLGLRGRRCKITAAITAEEGAVAHARIVLQEKA